MSTEEILGEALSGIKPDEEDAETLRAVARDIIKILDTNAKNMGLDVYAVHVGSTARNTWLKGTKDIDIFLMFPPETPREKLEEYGLKLARTVSDHCVEKYAEHPYIKTVFEGVDIDLVPCYRVSDSSRIQSAVDRSPFHNRYVQSHIGELCDDARLLKQFTRGAGVYGSELKTQGFSGYLCELLVIYYGSFMNVIKSGANLRRGYVIDVNDHMDHFVEHPEPLIVIDPVDPKRNVAAALSEQKFFEFIDACRRFLKSPSMDMFFPPGIEPIDDEELKELLKKRGTLLVAVTFDSPDIVEDTLYPQLRRVEESVVGLLERHEFKVYRSGAWSDMDKCAIILEMLVWELPDIERHIGPPVDEKEHSLKFLEKYPDAYILGYRYVVDIPRRYTGAIDLIRAKLLTCGLGKNVAGSIREKFDVVTNEEILCLGDDLGKFLRELIRP
ncbi:CCA tRNA nucleotidyltransferase [Methanocella sp. CWC-04]|uniref:CCA-adding enzyme n=1 Tax=Methanooceanicella nereidis TaxID=2052831 RepID=A0AAP2RD48_9EURY|nr:CCA tRNA nucleotidyltransferase [Methanocella sp. CWC-04]MCD1294696.1 CCA tRNA nucleotidyltransferase [Methanocella sp. CWC-04]